MLRLNSRAGTEGSTVSSLICDRWLILGLETLSISRWTNVMNGQSWMALFTCTAKLDPGAHGARCAWAMAVHHAVGISRQINSGYRPSRVNIMAQGLFTPDPSLSPTHLSIYKEVEQQLHYTNHQVSLMVSWNTTLVPSLGLCIGPACEVGLSSGMRRECVPPQNKKEEESPHIIHTKFHTGARNASIRISL